MILITIDILQATTAVLIAYAPLSERGVARDTLVYRAPQLYLRPGMQSIARTKYTGYTSSL